ncbi:MAG: methyltransferase, partial [Pseudorhodobacter sp.]|nr:methyltransferase [Pseudorhodobacter sp.]
LAGDVFYGRQVAARVLPVLDGFRAAGARVLVGDPGRVDLPRDGLELLAELEVRDMGDGPGKTTSCGVFDYRP